MAGILAGAAEARYLRELNECGSGSGSGDVPTYKERVWKFEQETDESGDTSSRCITAEDDSSSGSSSGNARPRRLIVTDCASSKDDEQLFFWDESGR